MFERLKDFFKQRGVTPQEQTEINANPNQSYNQTIYNQQFVTNGFLLVRLRPLYPVFVNKVVYYTWSDFFSDLGGTLKIFEVFIIIASLFIHDEYYKYLARKVSDQKRRSDKEVMNILSSEGIIRHND